MEQKVQFSYFTYLLFLLLCIDNLYAQHIIEVKRSFPAPRWAGLEQRVLSENLDFLKVVKSKYINPVTGHLECVEHWGGADGPDDAMENFYNWSLLYCLGAPKQTLDIFKFIWNGHIDQYTNTSIRDPRGSTVYYREFISAYDWEHTGEGIAPFLLLPLSDPHDSLTRERIVRFADFYTGRDTSTQNYDPEHKIIRSVFNGSRKPWLSATPDQILLNNNSWRTRGSAGVMGDVPLNLIATSLAVNAYMLTGDEHYKNWVVEYTGAWLDRTIQNDWIIPSNVGLNGTIGEHWEGKWYGGIMGWDWNFGGFNILGRGMRIGYGNGYFLSHDTLFLEALRKQGNILYYNYQSTNSYYDNFGSPFWYEPLSAPVNELTSWFGRDRSTDTWYELRSNKTLGDHFVDLYTWSWDSKDKNMINKMEETQYEDWLIFLEGNYSEYPEHILEAAISDLQQLKDMVEADNTTPSQRLSDHGPWPAATSALVNLTLGGLQPTKSGGLLYCQLRYFDPVNKRPGLPPDIGALIHTIDKEKVIVTLVNTHASEYRDIIVQTGAYGEHQCIKYMMDSIGHLLDTNHLYFRIAPASGNVITLYLLRNYNKPTLAFPWDPPVGSNPSIYNPILSVRIYPNPFIHSTRIIFEVQEKAEIKATIYSLTGIPIEVLCKREYDKGKHILSWSPHNMPPGIYFCILETGKRIIIKKLLFMK